MFSDTNRPIDPSSSFNSSLYIDGNDMFDEMYPELKQFGGQDEFQQPTTGKTADSIQKPSGSPASLRRAASNLQDAEPPASTPYAANNDYMLLDMLSNDVAQSYQNRSGLF